MAKIVYEVVPLDFGADGRTGWYLQRVTIALNAEGKPMQIVARTPVAQFLLGDVISEVVLLQAAVAQDTLRVMPKNWTFDDL